MRQLLSILLFLSLSLPVLAQTATYLTPVSVTTGNEQINSNHGIRAIWGAPLYTNDRAVVKFNETITSGESVSFDISNVNNTYLIGLTTSTVQTNLYGDPVGNTSIPFGMMVGNSAQARAYEAGYLIGPSTALTTGNVLRIYDSSGFVLYQKSTNAGVSYSTFYTSLTAPSGSYTVYFEAPPQGAGPDNLFKTGVAVNQPPLVSAGTDISVSLPLTETTLYGTSSDVDGTIASRTWTKILGPTGGSILNASSDMTQITGLTEGFYVFRYSITDNSGASATDEVYVTVAAADPNGTTIISPSIIPFSDPEIVGHGRGAEDWQYQNYVNIPTEAVQTERKSLYFRWAWTEIETGDNVFNWVNFDREIRIAISKGQTFSFSLMSQTATGSWRTGFADVTAGGYPMRYPLYLHNLMQAEAANSQDFISTSAGEWVPNYNSPNYIAKLKRLNDSINVHIQNSSWLGVPYKNVIDYIDIGAVGAYGEWHFNTVISNPSQWPTGREPLTPGLDSIISQTANAYNTFKTVINVSAYDAQQLTNTWIPPAVTYFALTKENAWGKIGWRREQFGLADNGATYIHTWMDQNLKTFGGIRFDTVIMARYKYAPTVGEPPGNWDNGDVPVMKNLPREIKFYNVSSFGNGNIVTNPMYRPDLLSAGTRDSVRMASKLAGYRIQIDSAVMSTQGTIGGTMTVKIYWRNTGVTPVYDKYFVKFRVKDQSGVTKITDTSSFKPFLFQPSSTATVYTDQIEIPSVFSAGTYSLSMSIEDSLGYRQPLAIANYGRQTDGSHTLRNAFSVLTNTANQSPTVSIAETGSVQLPLSTDTLYAAANDPDGTISSYLWTKISGPSGGTIVTSTAASTRIIGLTAGTYVYQVLVTDNSGATAIDSKVITVLSANVGPLANAGGDIVLYGSGLSTYINGTASDADGSVASTVWSKLSGPSGGTIVTPNTLITLVSGLVTGTYVYRLTVTDNLGAVTTDDVQISVVSGAAPRRRVIIKK